MKKVSTLSFVLQVGAYLGIAKISGAYLAKYSERIVYSRSYFFSNHKLISRDAYNIIPAVGECKFQIETIIQKSNVLN